MLYNLIIKMFHLILAIIFIIKLFEGKDGCLGAELLAAVGYGGVGALLSPSGKFHNYFFKIIYF